MSSDELDKIAESVLYATESESLGISDEERDWPDHTDPEWLYLQYHVQMKDSTEMGESAGVDPSTVLKWMRKHGIPRRDKAKANSLATGGDRMLWDEEWVRKQYAENKRTIADIAEERDVSRTAVRNALRRFDIDTRDQSEQARLQFNSKYGGEDYNREKWLRHQYLRLGKSTIEIAEENGWSPQTINSALEKHNIPRRSVRAAKLNQYKKEKCESGGDARELVSSAGIDASWRDLHERDMGCHLLYRDRGWLKKKVDQGLTDGEIRGRCGADVTRQTIVNWRQRFGIERE